MSTVASTPLSPPPIPASALPNGGSRPLADDVFQSAEDAVLMQSTLPDAMGAASPDARPVPVQGGSGSVLQTVRSQVAARPCEAALLAAAAGALAAWLLRRRLSRRFDSY
jgi:hypothetical protein